MGSRGIEVRMFLGEEACSRFLIIVEVPRVVGLVLF